MEFEPMLRISLPGDREIAMTRHFDAPRSAVFEAWTKPEILRQWNGPRDFSFVECEVDLRVGGSYRFAWRGTDGVKIGMRGIFRDIVRPERLVATETFDVPWYPGEAVVTIVFAEHGGGTLMTRTTLYESREARDIVLRSPMKEGAAQSYDRLAERLASLSIA